MTSPETGSRIQSGSVTPMHPRAGGAAALTESHTIRPDDGKLQSHQLPLPTMAISNGCPFSPMCSAATTPSAPHSPSRAENPTNPTSWWKKSQLLGRGTFGHVYISFNSESVEMCAMKDVTLFSDDAKSKECAHQLCQEIVMLSRLRHPNMVQYYGSKTVDDKLYIYWSLCLVDQSINCFRIMATLVKWPFVIILIKFCLASHTYMLKIPSIGTSKEQTYW